MKKVHVNKVYLSSSVGPITLSTFVYNVRGVTYEIVYHTTFMNVDKLDK